jgi:nucleoside-diphosphate-sugar epimerase/glycosyltransferase involved in cell wall biosynthesis
MVPVNAYISSLKGPILITGAAGFVGSNLFRMLTIVREDVFAVVRRDKGWRLADVKDEQIIVADLNNQTEVKHMIDELNPQTVFDCVAYGAYSFEEDPVLIHETNYQAIVKLVGELAGRSIKAFVHAGSSSEYGDNCSAPSELAECRPNSHYSVSKLAAANFLHFMGKSYCFPCVNLRLYAVYGPLEDTSRLIPNLLRQAVLGKLPPFVNARTSRDFIHIDDVCEAFIMTAAKMNPSLFGETLNIGSGVKTTIEELATIAKRLFGIACDPIFGSMEGRKWDLPEWYADNSKAASVLEWRPKISLDNGLKSTALWIAGLSEDDFSFTSKKIHSQRRRSVSAIIACYQDAQAIPVMHQRLTATFRKLGIDYEIIFVNDGSPDDSARVIQEISKTDSHVVGVTHSRNFGSQMAFRSGMELSTKDSVVLLDGDLQDPPELIEKFYGKWEEGWDVIYGRRVRREMPWYWGAMYKLFYRIFALFSYIRIPLDAGDFSLIDRRVVGWLLKCPERDLFMRGLRAYVGFRQTGVDYVRPDRMFGRTTNSLVKNIDWAKKGIFSFSNAPLTMLTTVGIVAFVLSAGIGFLTIILRIMFPDIAPRGVTTLLVVTLMFGSFNLFAIGLVGEYVAKIMAEVKGRPRLIRTEIVRDGEVRVLLPDGKS